MHENEGMACINVQQQRIKSGEEEKDKGVMRSGEGQFSTHTNIGAKRLLHGVDTIIINELGIYKRTGYSTHIHIYIDTKSPSHFSFSTSQPIPSIHIPTSPKTHAYTQPP